MLRTNSWQRALLLVILPMSSPAQQNPPPPPADAAAVRAEIQRVESARAEIPDRGAVLFLLAKRYTHLGEPQKAISLLKECVALDEGFDPDNYPPLESLRALPEFRALVAQVHLLHPPVHRSRVAFDVPEADLIPEGLAYDPAARVFYLGSMHRRKIVRITEAGEVSDFVKPELYGLMPVGGVHVDPADRSVWAASDPGEARRSELLHFDSQGKLLERYPAPGPGPHDLNDLVLRGATEIFVTDTDGHKVYRFDRKSHAFTALAFPRPLFYPNGITVSAEESLLYVADLMGVLQVDLPNNQVREVHPGKGNTLAGIDGLYWYKNSLLAAQYGTGAFRIARFQLSPDGTRVTRSEVLEYRTPVLSFPTTGAIAGNQFYFIANTGIDNWDGEKDQILDPAKLEPVHIAVVPLEQ
jgi:DNA-binding beta-propeller fold protein YncE